MKTFVFSLVVVLMAISAVYAGITPVPVYTVKPGDYLIKIARMAGQGDRAYIKIVELNPDLFPVRKLYNPSHDLIYPGQRLVVPEKWAERLGLIDKTPPPDIKAQVPLIQTVSAHTDFWPFLVAFLAMLFVLGIAAFARPWNFFRPASSGPAVVPAGVRTPEEAIEIICKRVARELDANLSRATTIPRPFQIERLWEIRLFGTLLVRYADGREERKIAAGQRAWLAELTDGSRYILLEKCGNDVKFYGRTNTLLDGHYTIVREIDITGFSRDIPVPETEPVVSPSAPAVIPAAETEEENVVPEPEPESGPGPESKIIIGPPRRRLVRVRLGQRQWRYRP